MNKFVSVLSAVLLVCGLLELVSARSATSTQYQQINGVHETASSSTSTTITPSATEQLKDMLNENLIGASPNIWKDLSFVYKIYQQCATENFSVCLKVKLLAGLERVFRATKTLKLMEGVQFVTSDSETQNENTISHTKPPSEQDIQAILPRATDAKEFVLNNMIFKKLSNFLQDHTLQIKFPDIHEPENNDLEARKKKDKKGGGAYIMIPLLLGGTFVPIAYGALAMLAGKALIVSKLALVLASIIGIKKLLSGGGKESHEVVVSSGSHSGWGRDIDLAYNGWKPANKETAKIR